MLFDFLNSKTHPLLTQAYWSIGIVVGVIVFIRFIVKHHAEITRGFDRNIICSSLLAIVWLFNPLQLAVLAALFWPGVLIFWILTYESKEKRLQRMKNEEAARQQRLIDEKIREDKLKEEQRVRAEILAKEMEAHARIRWEKYYSMSDTRHIEKMTGKQFEKFIASLYSRMGYEVTLTNDGADQGADILMKAPDGHRIAVQAKRWSSAVGNTAIQEVMAARVYYDCTEGIVITNSNFTRSAIDLARKDKMITLIDGQALTELCMKYQGRTIPEFSIEKYQKIKKLAESIYD